MVQDLSTLVSRLRSVLGHLPRALSLAFAAAPGWTILWIVLLAIQGLLPVALVYLTRGVVNSLVQAVGGGTDWENIQPLLVLGSCLGGVILLSEVLGSVIEGVRTVQAELFQDHVQGLIHTQSIAADLAFYEMPDYYDHLHRARAEAGSRPAGMLQSLGSLVQNTLTLAAMGAVLLPYGLWLPVALVTSTLPAFFVVLRSAFKQHNLHQRTTAIERRTWYYDWLLTAGDAAAELRLFHLGPHFHSQYQDLRRQLRGERMKLARSQMLAELGAGLAALLATGASLTWMGWQALQGKVTLGDLALFYQAFAQGQRLLRSLLQNVGALYANSLFLGNLFEFLELKPRVVAPVSPLATPLLLVDGIRFEKVAFRYPGSERLALHDFDLTIPAGQVVALVGPNGSGKSTVLKLLCRFYDPDVGRIRLDGLNLCDLDPAALRERITVLFQQPLHYNATVAENILLGNLAPGASETAMKEAARAAGADETVAHLPHGYQTLLGKWFAGGTELSGGEWQRLALARAFLRQAPVILLDEPTSAMDSWAEADWLRRFRQLAAGRTVVIITHRFTTAMRADTIHVMVEGKVVESGGHVDLLAQGGLYARSWATQMKAKSE